MNNQALIAEMADLKLAATISPVEYYGIYDYLKRFEFVNVTQNEMRLVVHVLMTTPHLMRYVLVEPKALQRCLDILLYASRFEENHLTIFRLLSSSFDKTFSLFHSCLQTKNKAVISSVRQIIDSLSESISPNEVLNLFAQPGIVALFSAPVVDKFVRNLIRYISKDRDTDQIKLLKTFYGFAIDKSFPIPVSTSFQSMMYNAISRSLDAHPNENAFVLKLLSMEPFAKSIKADESADVREQWVFLYLNLYIQTLMSNKFNVVTITQLKHFFKSKEECFDAVLSLSDGYEKSLICNNLLNSKSAFQQFIFTPFRFQKKKRELLEQAMLVCRPEPIELLNSSTSEYEQLFSMTSKVQFFSNSCASSESEDENREITPIHSR